MKNSLYNLIHSLSTAEKRQYKIFSKYNKGSSKYSLLFDAINKQRDYNEAILIKKFDYVANPNGFSVAKHHLTSSILDFLRTKKKKHSTFDLINRNLIDIETLYDHKLYDECLTLLNKTIEIATAYPFNLFLPVLGDWKFRLAYQHNSNKKMYTTFNEGVAIQNHSISKLNNERIYFSLYEKLFFENCLNGFAKKGKALDRSMTLKNSPYLLDYTQAHSTSSKLAFHLAHIEVAKSEFNTKKQLKHGREIKQLLDSPEAKNPMLWLVGMAEYLEAIVLNGLKEEFDLNFLALQEFPISNNAEDLVRKKEMSLLFIETLSSTVFLPSKLAENNTIERGTAYFNQYKTTFNSRHEIKYLYHTAKYYYWTGQPKKASSWTAKLFSVLNKDYFIDCYLMTTFLFSVTHFDLGNIELIVDKMPGFRKFLLSTGRMTPTEAFILKTFNELLNVYHDKRTKKTTIKALQVELKTISQFTNSHPVLDLNQAILWTESKLKNKTMMELYHEQYKPKFSIT